MNSGLLIIDCQDFETHESQKGLDWKSKEDIEEDIEEGVEEKEPCFPLPKNIQEIEP